MDLIYGTVFRYSTVCIHLVDLTNTALVRYCTVGVGVNCRCTVGRITFNIPIVNREIFF